MKNIGKAKKKYLKILEEIESDIIILSERIKRAKENVPDIHKMKDVERWYNSENGLEEGLMHIELYL